MSGSPKIFLSHAFKDKKLFADRFSEELGKRIANVWYSGEGVKHGEDFSQRISEAIKESNYVVLLLSENFADAKWAMAEYNIAVDLYNRGETLLIPVWVKMSREQINRNFIMVAGIKAIQCDGTSNGVIHAAQEVANAIAGRPPIAPQVIKPRFWSYPVVGKFKVWHFALILSAISLASLLFWLLITNDEPGGPPIDNSFAVRLVNIADAPFASRAGLVQSMGFTVSDSFVDPNAIVYQRGQDKELLGVCMNGALQFLSDDATGIHRFEQFFAERTGSSRLPDSVTGDLLKFKVWTDGVHRFTSGVDAGCGKFMVEIFNPTVQVPKLLTAGELGGTWGRMGASSLDPTGRMIFNANFTFTLEESEEGSISGTWKFNEEEQRLELHYGKAKNGSYDFYTPHALNLKTEVIHILSRKGNEVSGQLQGGVRNSNVTLVKR